MANLGLGPRSSDAEGCGLVYVAGLHSLCHCSTRIKMMTLTLNLNINFCRGKKIIWPKGIAF